MNSHDVFRGDSPIVVGQPHGGTFVPEDIYAQLNENGRKLADTDWHITQLYDGLLDNATVVKSNIHRYVIDANRDPEGVSLYPGQNTTTLAPLTDFDRQNIWKEGQKPSADETEARRAAYHAPYHAALRAELERVRDRHGVAILFDCHSIRSEIPFLFEGALPHFSIGTNLGATCAREIEQAAITVCGNAAGYSSVTNGRFKGGWTTRHYGRPETGIHAIQMELAQSAYMQESAPWTYLEARAEKLRPHLKTFLHNLNNLALSGALTRQGASQ